MFLTKIIKKEIGKDIGKPTTKIPFRKRLHDILDSVFNPDNPIQTPYKEINFNEKSNKAEVIYLLEAIGMVKVEKNKSVAYNSMKYDKWDGKSKKGIFSSKEQYLEFLKQLIKLTE